MAAALATYPGATGVRVETDSDGVYEAHLTTIAGQDVVVQIGSGFAVTGTQQSGGHGRGGNAGGADDTAIPGSSSSSSETSRSGPGSANRRLSPAARVASSPPAFLPKPFAAPP